MFFQRFGFKNHPSVEQIQKWIQKRHTNIKNDTNMVPKWNHLVPERFPAAPQRKTKITSP
jgi:hypothetical protein